MRVPQDERYWREEIAFILREMSLPSDRRMWSFQSYVRMQSNFCWRDGFQDLAQQMAATIGLEINEGVHAKWAKVLEETPK
jgi:hypothetical protein